MWKIVLLIIALNSQGAPVIQDAREQQDQVYRNAAECNRALLSQSPDEERALGAGVKDRSMTGRFFMVGCSIQGPDVPLTEDEK